MRGGGGDNANGLLLDREELSTPIATRESPVENPHPPNSENESSSRSDHDEKEEVLESERDSLLGGGGTPSTLHNPGHGPPVDTISEDSRLLGSSSNSHTRPTENITRSSSLVSVSLPVLTESSTKPSTNYPSKSSRPNLPEELNAGLGGT